MNALEITAVFLTTLVFYLHVKSHLITCDESVLLRATDTELSAVSDLARTRQPVLFPAKADFSNVEPLTFERANKQLLESFLPRLRTRFLLEKVNPDSFLLVESAYRHVLFGEATLQLWHPARLKHSTGLEQNPKQCDNLLLGRCRVLGSVGPPEIEVVVGTGEAIYIPPYWGYKVVSGNTWQILCYTPLNVLAIKVRAVLRIIGL